MNVSPKLLADLAQITTDRGQRYTLQDLTEDQVIDLAAGWVPSLVKAMCRTLLDQDDILRRAEGRAEADRIRAERKKRG